MPSVLSVVAWAAGMMSLGVQGMSASASSSSALRRRLQFQGTPQGLLNGLNPGAATSTAPATNEIIDEIYITNADGPETMMAGESMGSLAKLGNGGEPTNYGGIRFSEGHVEPIRGFEFELTSGGKGRVKVTTLLDVQVRDPFLLKPNSTPFGAGEYEMTDILAQHEMNCNAETWQAQDPYKDGYGSVMMMILPRRCPQVGTQPGDWADCLYFSFRCARSSIVSTIIETAADGWDNMDQGWHYTNWGPVGDMASLADHPVMCPEGKALWHLKAETENGQFRWSYRCFEVIKREATDSPTLAPTASPTDDPCLGVEPLTKKTHKKLCKTFHDASQAECEAAVGKWKTKVAKNGNLKTKCKKLKGPAIQCEKASLEHCCKFPGCSVENGQCTGTFLGY